MHIKYWIGLHIAYLTISVLSVMGEDSLALPLALYEDADWEGVRRECRRVLIPHPVAYDAMLLDSSAALRAGVYSTNIIQALLTVFEESSNCALQVMAAYEVGRVYWRKNNPDQAYLYIKYALQHACDQQMLLHSACSLELMMDEYGKKLPDDPLVEMQLHTLRGLLWPKVLHEECEMDRNPDAASVFSVPGKWVTAFYRSQIRPAIGDRCQIHPSCSEYFKQACSKHGLLGFTIYADRGVREPDMIKYEMNPVIIDGKRKFADPLEAHDWWLNE